MTRLVRSFLTALVLFAVLAGSLPAQAAPVPVQTDVSKQVAKVEAFKQLVDLLSVYKQGQPVDFDAALALYTTGLQATVRARDAEYGEELDNTLLAALAAGKSGELSAGIAKQLVDKLGQKVFYLTIKHELTMAKEKLAKGDRQGAVHHVDEAIAYFEALRVTVQKRDKAYGTNLEAEIDGALAEAQKAAAAGDEDRLWFVAPVITHNLQRTFMLALAGYAGKVEAGAQAGKDVRVEMAEGWAFFQSIKGTVAKRTPELAKLVDDRMNPVQGDPALVKAAEIKAAVAAGFAGYVEHEVDATWQNWESRKRLHTAMEGAIIARAIEAEVETVLGAQARQEFSAHTQAFAEAVWAGNREQAELHGKALAAQAAALRTAYTARLTGTPADAIVLTIGQAEVAVYGRTRSLEAAPFVKGGRTMVPVRLVAEELGATVTWLDATGTVQIVAGGKEILLPVGQLEARVNGQPVALDAAAEIVGGRTFVPVRFVSEVLGARVDWDSARQQVLIRPAQ